MLIAVSNLNEFNEPTSIIIKHTNACGVASAKNINEAFQNPSKVTVKVRLEE